MKDCPFCPLIERKTEWYYFDVENGIVVCEDLKPKNFKYRLLVVGCGKHWHREKYNKEMISALEGPLRAVSEAHISEGKATSYTVDKHTSSVKQHYHLQSEMR